MHKENVGLWRGMEVEHTKFHGVETVFLEGTSQALDFVLHNLDKFGTDFFYVNGIRNYFTLPKIADILAKGKKVSLDVTEHSYTNNRPFIDCLRRMFANQFCLVLTIEMTSPEVGAFAVKIQSEERAKVGLQNEPPAFVSTVDSHYFIEDWKDHRTRPEAYLNDQAVKL